LPAENQTVNSTFTITSATTDNLPVQLFINVSNQGISFIQFNKESNTFIAVMVYQFATHLSPTEIVGQINKIISQDIFLQKNFASITVIYSFAECVLVPTAFFNTNSNQALATVYGDAVDGNIKTELVEKHHLYCMYRVPSAIERCLAAAFTITHTTHHYGLLVKQQDFENPSFYVNFTSDTFTVLLINDDKLQVIQTFDFTTPEDAIYHLLNVCACFETEATTTSLMVSGMIDVSSKLYTELHKYFEAINFSTLPNGVNYIDEIKDYPEHYFSHLFSTAICVL
jgi:hypothetical protein